MFLNHEYKFYSFVFLIWNHSCELDLVAYLYATMMAGHTMMS
jgi:hypothetical protein